MCASGAEKRVNRKYLFTGGKKSWPLRERTITKSNFYLTLKASNLFDQNKNT